MNTNANATEDIDLAIETLERRVNHLSDRIHNPPPGKPPFWRDEAELKALRIALRSIKLGRLSGDMLPTLSNAADAMEDMLSWMESMGNPAPKALPEWRARAEALDRVIDGFDGT